MQASAPLPGPEESSAANTQMIGATPNPTGASSPAQLGRGSSVGGDSRAQLLVFRAGAIIGAIPLATVLETFRPLPVERIPGTAACVLGASLIRGQATPVVDARILFSTSATAPSSRIVLLRVASRAVGLAVDSVLGIRQFEEATFRELPPLLQVADAGLVSEIGRLDSDLFVLLDSARLVPESVWSALDAQWAAR